ncbi:hypothetical protein [Gilliamella sp. wkB112]|uniref:hypothetical protein n=1 Tax=Gilliamella sp. wkB112 TaxID=3120257 RepID=UPI00080EB4C2|nr:hypothetical protein [Gilliamella apicola]OCG00760.1 hypothetical protein A9G12_03070 [Gilliamella apicola]
MNYIKNEKEFTSFLESIDWHDSFIRELYVQSPSYITKDGGTVASDSLWSAKLLIIIYDSVVSGVELFFEGLESFSLSANIDIEPKGKVENSQYYFYVNAYSVPIIAKKISYYCYGKEIQGYSNKYGVMNLFDEDGFPLKGDYLNSSE